MFVSVVIIAMLLFIIFDNNRAIKILVAKNKKLQEKIDILTKRLQAVENKEEENQYSSVVQEENFLSGEEKTQDDVFTKTDICENNTIKGFIPIEGNSSSKKFNDTWEKIKSAYDSKEKKQVKNTILLALGAFFIVIAAISFLYSTWYTVPDFLKTSVILVLAGVFLGISHVADKVFELKKTASTFFYIAMAYIPICLVSISAFGFLGEYFSFSGEGKFVYLAFVSLLVSIIYLVFGYKHNDEKLYYASRFMQIIFVGCAVSIVTIKPLNILCGILVYTIILNILNSRYENDFLLQSKLFNKLFIYIISSISILSSLFMFAGELSETLLMLGAFINGIILYAKEKKKEIFGITYILGFLAMIKIFMYNKFDFQFIHYQIATIVVLLLTTFYYNFREKDTIIKKIVNWINLGVLCLVYIFTLTSFTSLDIFILGVLGNLIAFTVYIKNNKEQYELFSLTAIFSSIFLLIPDVKHVNTMVTLSFYEVSFIGYLTCMISAAAMFILLFKDKNKYLKIIPLFIFFANLYRYQWIVGENFDITYYLNIVFAGTSALFAIKDRKDIIYRVTSYVFLIGWFIYGKIDIYVATLIIIIFGIIQSIFAEQNIKNGINAITTIALSVMYIVMINELPNVGVEAYILSIVSSLVFWYAFCRTKYVKVLPMLGLMIPLFNYDIIVKDTSNLSFILNACTVFLFAYISFVNRKHDEYKLVSFVYLIAFFIKYEVGLSVLAFSVIIWALLQIIISTKVMREILKGLILLTLATMYYGTYMEVLNSDITTKSYALTIIASLIAWVMLSRTKYLKAFPMLGLMIPLFNYDLTLMGQYDITFIVNLGMVGLFTYMSTVGKKENLYKGISFIYLLALLLKYNEINVYIKHFMLIIWAVCELLHSDGILKDIFKALISTVALNMYVIVLNDLQMVEVTAFLLVGFLVYTHIITRVVLKEYLEEYKILEYLASALIYLMSFSLFKDGVDLAIFIVMQVLVLMIAYAKKYGPVFAVTVVGVIINTFYLTQNFWLAIPWWIYLIIVGGALIVFAARNELSEKQDINTIKEKLNKIRNYLDM